MADRAKLSRAAMLRVMRHMADVAALRGDPPAQRQLLIDGLSEIVGTHSGFFYICDGWNVGGRPRFSHCTLTTQVDATFLRYTSDFGVNLPVEADPFCYHSIRDQSPFGTYTLGDVLPDRQARLRHAQSLDVMDTVRMRDGAISFYRTGDEGGRIIGVGMHEFGNVRKLTGAQLEIIRFAVAEVQRLDERGHLALPPKGPRELAPRLRQVLDRLLAGRAPKQIARELGLSVWTVREHIQRLYRHFEVAGRDELASRFVRP
jgi:DNA-binding CsgD family transcriptional regulator